MAKKKHRTNTIEKKSSDDSKMKKMKDPDPNSQEYMYDEIDMFNQSRDKILLDTSAEKKDDSELEENMDEEVLPLQCGESSSDDYSDLDNEDGEHEEEDGEHDKEDEEDDDDFSDESDADKELLSDKAWGHSKKAFYNADIEDDDIFASDEEAEIAAEEEEKEAMILQKRLAEKLDTDDFYAFGDEEEEEEEEVASSKVTVEKDLTKLSMRERLEILAEESPELLPLLDEYKEKFNEVRDRYHPLMLLVKNGIIRNPNGIKFIEFKHQLLLNYLVNISFYLALKSSKEKTKGHPVINVLVQHQQLFSQMKPLDEKLEGEITHFLTKYKDEIKNGTISNKNKDYIVDTSQTKTTDILEEFKHVTPKVVTKSSTIDPLEYYNLVKSKGEREKKAKKQKLDDEVVEHDESNEKKEDEDGKRMITYEMSKNKGLIRKRRKELKNPRVKHKMKFKKATVIRKGQVREVQREINRYGGETTGIKCTLARSTKIK